MSFLMDSSFTFFSFPESISLRVNFFSFSSLWPKD